MTIYLFLPSSYIIDMADGLDWSEDWSSQKNHIRQARQPTCVRHRLVKISPPTTTDLGAVGGPHEHLLDCAPSGSPRASAVSEIPRSQKPPFMVSRTPCEVEA